MTPKDFITLSVENISSVFPGLTISYKFDEPSMTHFLKVVPENTYVSKDFMEIEAKIYSDWYEKVNDLDHSFCIVSLNSLTQLIDDKILYQPEREFKISIVWNNQGTHSVTDHSSEVPVISANSHSFHLIGIDSLTSDLEDASFYPLAA